MPKVALICYHKGVEKLYPKQWVDEFRHSILNQTYKEFDIIEMNYGDDDFLIFGDKATEVIYYPQPTFAHAMNYLLDLCFNGLGYDYVFNSNCDDVADLKWFETILPHMEENDLVSSNFCLIKNDEIILTHHFDQLDIKKELDRDHNPIAHPSVCYSKRFWESNRYDPDDIPQEDMLLWKRAINNGYRFKIVPQVLLFHRLHDQSVGHKLKET